MPVANEWNSYFMQQNMSNKKRIKHPDELDRKLKQFGIWDMQWMKWGWHRGPKNNNPQYNSSGNKIINYTKNMSDIIYDKNNNFVDDDAVRSAKLKALHSYYKRKGYTLPIPITDQSMPYKSKVSNWMPSQPIITTNPVFTAGGAPLTPEPYPTTVVNPLLRAMRMNRPAGSAAVTVSGGGSTRRGYRNKKITRKRKSSYSS
jgi:hypothetical protein